MTAVTAAVVQRLQAPMFALHESGVNQNYDWRVEQLKKLKVLLQTHMKDFQDALAADLGKDVTESTCTEMLLVLGEIKLALANLKTWMKPTAVPSPVVFAPCLSEVQRVPLRAPGVLVIAPSNYPINLALSPVVGSLAGGNPAVIKPSELCPQTSQLLSRVIPMYFAPEDGVVQVIEGEGSDTAELCKAEWGMIFFTGSQRVGKLVAGAAAATLTPTVLELGGKCPCYVDELAPIDMRAVANRIIWGKMLNTGQTCVAPDYLLIHQRHATKLLKEMQATLEIQYGPDPSTSELGRIVNSQQAKRLVDLLQETEKEMESSSNGVSSSSASSSSTTPLRASKVLCGGAAKCDADKRYIAPTLLLQPPLTCRLWHEEIFGPILPIWIVESRKEAMDFIKAMPGTPLTLYAFTSSSAVFQEITRACPSAAACRNECTLHVASPHLPLAGLGSSGYGAYHGKFSFETFTHPFSTMYRPCLPGADYNMLRYHPFKGTKGKLLQAAVNYLTDIPVLHTRPLLTILFSLAVWKWIVPTPWQLQNSLPDLLVWLASQIRRL